MLEAESQCGFCGKRFTRACVECLAPAIMDALYRQADRIRELENSLAAAADNVRQAQELLADYASRAYPDPADRKPPAGERG